MSRADISSLANAVQNTFVEGSCSSYFRDSYAMEGQTLPCRFIVPLPHMYLAHNDLESVLMILHYCVHGANCLGEEVRAHPQSLELCHSLILLSRLPE